VKSSNAKVDKKPAIDAKKEAPKKDGMKKKTSKKSF